MINDPLKTFVTVVEHKNFSHAAEELYLSHPNVSLQIQTLEEELGTKLVDSSSNHLELTQAGEIYYKYAKQILRLHNKALQEIKQLSNVVTGTLKVGASYTIGEYILPFAVAEFAAQYPKVDIETSIANTEEIIQAVRTNQLDVALVEGEVDHSDILIHSIMEDEIILVVPNQHALARLPIATSEHLQDQVWILRESGSGTRAFSDKLIKEWGINVRKAYIFGSSQAVKQAVSTGLGIALVSRWIVRKELNAKELKSLRIKGKRLTRSFYLIQPKNHETSEVTEAFTEQLLNHELITSWRKLGKRNIDN
ncbi:LysR substrate-binding domain-containing protein [Desulfosporosinus sp. PR]|uniref:LysR substrate-binding domain-containing protein n=1 Tax=Candidatus Desulfosporosinus nitrosoreducens TaxID=3401928 RepID=UPI0027E8C6BF|nr:LysR substrate-binding domain-containing protein [Desulfosporosinus sp. PR]MDQ7094050.1 LysR substrate-binding domain-containing protein [Desulfosporosinus sp. PR]